jgi:hypothetical protein
MRVVRGIWLIIFLTLDVAVVVVAMDCFLPNREWEIELLCPGGASDEFLVEVFGFRIDPDDAR